MTTDQFSALRDFFRGYLHQDTLAEYGGALAAAAQFRADAGETHTATVQREFNAVRSALDQSDLAAVNAEIVRRGAAYQFGSLREWREFCDVLLEN